MNRAVGIELRRGVGPFSAPLVLVVLVAGLLVHQRDWAGEWTGSSYYLRFLLLIGGPVLVAAAVWQGGRSRRGPDTEVVRGDLANGVTSWGCDPLARPAPGDVAQQSYVLSAWLLDRRPTGQLEGHTDRQLLAITAAFSAAVKRCDAPAALAAVDPLR